VHDTIQPMPARYARDRNPRAFRDWELAKAARLELEALSGRNAPRG
jgi:hypothetical protein